MKWNSLCGLYGDREIVGKWLGFTLIHNFNRTHCSDLTNQNICILAISTNCVKIFAYSQPQQIVSKFFYTFYDSQSQPQSNRVSERWVKFQTKFVFWRLLCYEELLIIGLNKKLFQIFFNFTSWRTFKNEESWDFAVECLLSLME